MSILTILAALGVLGCVGGTLCITGYMSPNVYTGLILGDFKHNYTECYKKEFGEFAFSDNTFVGSNGGTSEPERLRYRRTVPVASVATSSRSTTPIAMGFSPLKASRTAGL
ncbi:hypothetical protein NOF04DRAFT_1280940 [Fusarium oxysporum II5]|nr:hypothetical protein NOF04DRAFT_1280940 [Fusarium oxysporum II5]